MRTSNFVGTINTWAMTTLFLLVAVVVVHEVEVCAFQSWSSPPTSWKSQPAVSKNVQAMTRRLSNLEQRQQRFGVPRSTRSTASTVALQETASPVDYAYSPLSLDNSLTTVIAFFPTRDTQHQQAFTEAFRAQVMPVLNEEQGFVCSHLFQAVDGSKMALYEQWTSYDECIAAYAPTSRSTQVREQMKSVLEIDGKSVDRHVYEVRSVGEIGCVSSIRRWYCCCFCHFFLFLALHFNYKDFDLKSFSGMMYSGEDSAHTLYNTS